MTVHLRTFSHTLQGCAFLVLLAALLAVFQPAAAQSFSPAALIAEVNALRASKGLAPYRVDSGLMAFAQEHSEYQASLGGYGTHTHSDGTLSWTHGIQENVASGDSQSLTTSVIVYQIWADAGHRRTMTGYASGSVGVGVASKGNMVYVTLNVRPDSAASTGSGSSASAGKPASPATSIALVPLTTNTPRPDGSIVHEVGYGQSLWSIAISYGVKINDIRALNGLAADSTDIYAGQKLLIRAKGSVTPTAALSPTMTASPASTTTPTARPSATPHPTRIASATPGSSLASAARPTVQPSNRSSLELSGRTILAGLIFLSAAILLGVFLWTFRK